MIKVALICSHNGEKYLPEQVRSMLCQSVPLDHIIIHDYSSTDGTRAVIEAVKKESDKISSHYFDEAKSACHSFLHSISWVRDHFNGLDYVLFLSDQDDVWVETKNESVLKYLQEGADFVFHDVMIADSDLNVLKPSFYQNFWDVKRDFSLPSLYLSNCVIGHTITVTGKFLRQINLDYDERIPMHDWYLALWVLRRGFPNRFIPEALSYYRQHTNNVLGASQANPLAKIKKSYRHGRALLRYQEFLLERGFNTSSDLWYLFKNSLKMSPPSKMIFLLLTLFFSTFYRLGISKG
jgi:glycosyltransferase involved in cell wall biosynthesis